eukprot:9242890-Prorocentrum_lima.AAC.1
MGNRYRYPEHEEFLVQMEAYMNPRYWSHGSDCVNFNPRSHVKAVQYEDICQFVHDCFWSNNGRILDDVF